jgi:hypothetical protein
LVVLAPALELAVLAPELAPAALVAKDRAERAVLLASKVLFRALSKELAKPLLQEALPAPAPPLALLPEREGLPARAAR